MIWLRIALALYFTVVFLGTAFGQNPTITLGNTTRDLTRTERRVAIFITGLVALGAWVIVVIGDLL